VDVIGHDDERIEIDPGEVVRDRCPTVRCDAADRTGIKDASVDPAKETGSAGGTDRDEVGTCLCVVKLPETN
jgi:hypothetical protein